MGFFSFFIEFLFFSNFFVTFLSLEGQKGHKFFIKKLLRRKRIWLISLF
jgi:hypothetical protein